MDCDCMHIQHRDICIFRVIMVCPPPTHTQHSMSPDVTVVKHCVLVLNQPPSHHPCVESLKHAGKTPPQIIKLLVEVNNPCVQ